MTTPLPPDSAAAARAASHRRYLLLIVLVGVALRIWMIAVTPLDPRFSNADDGDYYRRAMRLAVTGQYLDDFWLIRPPLHVFFYAAWLKLALALGIPQHGVLMIQIGQLLASVATSLAGYAAARRMFRSGLAGLLFAGFLSLWYPFVEQPTVLFSELIYLALFTAHLWLLLRSDESGARRDLFLSGVALGAAALTRSPALYSLAFVGVWVLLRPQPPGVSAAAGGGWWARLAPRLAALLLVAAGCLLVVLPWTARNYVLYQRIIPVDTLGQINLWLDLDSVGERNAHIETLRGLPQAERAEYAMARAREILAEDPWRPFESMWPTFQHIWKAQFIEDFFVKQSFFTRPLRETAWLGLIGDVAWLIFTMAGLIGLAGPLREGLHRRLYSLAWLGYSLLTVLVFHVEPRYLLPIWMLIALYGAGELARALTGAQHAALARGPRWRLALQIAVAVAFLWLFLSYRDYGRILSAGIAREQRYVPAERAYQAGDYLAAEAGFRGALDAQPSFVDAQVGLALALGAQGRTQEALAVLRRDSSRRAELAYGALMRDSGDLETASAQFTRYESIAGEDVQSWALSWFRPPPSERVAVGGGLDLGYVRGFLEAEQTPTDRFRWLSGAGSVTLPLPAPLAPGRSVLLRLTSGRDRATPLTVRVGDGPPQTIMVGGGTWRSYLLSIPPELAGATELTVALSAPTFVPALTTPGSDDARALSLMVAEVRVQ